MVTVTHVYSPFMSPDIKYWYMHSESSRTDILSHSLKYIYLFSNFRSIQLMQDLNYHGKSEYDKGLKHFLLKTGTSEELSLKHT